MISVPECQSVASEAIQSLGTFRKAIRSTHNLIMMNVFNHSRETVTFNTAVSWKSINWRISWKKKNEQAVPLEHDDDNDDDVIYYALDD